MNKKQGQTTIDTQPGCVNKKEGVQNSLLNYQLALKPKSRGACFCFAAQ